MSIRLQFMVLTYNTFKAGQNDHHFESISNAFSCKKKLDFDWTFTEEGQGSFWWWALGKIAHHILKMPTNYMESGNFFFTILCLLFIENIHIQ